MNRVVEILAPAGSMECLQAAIAAGADAVYLGGTRFGARAYAQNLSEEDMVQAIEYVHIHRRKIYMTVNTLLKDREMEELYAYLLPYYRAGLDGVIVQDIGVVKYIREHFPKMPVHASTQMTITNTLGADHLKQYGITRVVPARELSLGEIRDMKRQTGLEMECFVHVLLLFRTVPSQQYDRRTERQQRTVRTAVPSSLSDRWKETGRSDESEGSVYNRHFAGTDRCGG